VLLELPHGGHLTPMEVKSYLHPKFTPGDRREDSDEFSDAIYLGLPARPHILRFGIWRAHADPNREYTDYSDDGAVKTRTSQGVKIYQSDHGLPSGIRATIVEQYIKPHRERLQRLLESPAVEKVIFCHTMPGIGTRTSGDSGNLRPLFMFANGGSPDGTPPNDAYATRELLLQMADIVEQHFDNLDADFNYCDITRFNDPYTGINSLGRFEPGVVAGKQPFTLEINRDLILHNPDNIEPTRAIVNAIVLAASAYQNTRRMPQGPVID
jgi:hypothetical protein